MITLAFVIALGVGIKFAAEDRPGFRETSHLS
jgi:hypothetical protein